MRRDGYTVTKGQAIVDLREARYQGHAVCPFLSSGELGLIVPAVRAVVHL